MEYFNVDNAKIILNKYVRDKNVPAAMMWYRKIHKDVGMKEAQESVEALMAGKPTYEELEAQNKSLKLAMGEIQQLVHEFMPDNHLYAGHDNIDLIRQLLTELTNTVKD